MNRFWVAMGAYAVLALLAWTTITEQKFRWATLAFLALFAIRTISWSRKQEREDREERDRRE